LSRRCCTVGQVRVICCLKLSFTNPVKTCLVISLPFSHFQYECIIILDSMLDTLKWKSLQHRRRDARLHMLYKTYHEDVAISKEERLIPPETCIRYISFQVPSSSSDYRKYSFFPRTIRDWNSLPTNTAAATTLVAFKAQVSQLPH
jgi:hypothetical protein